MSVNVANDAWNKSRFKVLQACSKKTRSWNNFLLLKLIIRISIFCIKLNTIFESIILLIKSYWGQRAWWNICECHVYHCLIKALWNIQQTSISTVYIYILIFLLIRWLFTEHQPRFKQFHSLYAVKMSNI